MSLLVPVVVLIAVFALAIVVLRVAHRWQDR
jgi:hypothetical protein